MRDKLIEIYTTDNKINLINPDHIVNIVVNDKTNTIILSNGNEIETEISSKKIYRLIHLEK